MSEVKKGSVDVSRYIVLRDSADGSPETGYTITDLDLQYTRSGAAPAAKVDATALAATNSAHGDNKAIEIDATSSPGLIRVDWPDAAFATGADAVILAVTGTGLDPSYEEVQLVTLGLTQTAADNLELQYNGTGLTGDTFPASQAQVGAIAATSVGGFPAAIEADNTGGAIKTVSFVGVETSGTFADTEADNGIYHQIDDVANEIDIIYQADVTGARTGIDILFKGYLSGANDEINVQAYDYVGLDWETLKVIEGQAGSIDIEETIPLLTKHTGLTGSDAGKVLIRFQTTGQSNPTLYVNRLLVVGANLGQSVGYENGAIWIDTLLGTAGTVPFLNGTADNPISTWADFVTLSTSVGMIRAHIANGSSIALSGDSTNYVLEGDGIAGWSLDLNGQVIDGISVRGAIVTGTATNGGTTPAFIDCRITTATLPPCSLDTCELIGPITAQSAGNFYLNRCSSGVAGPTVPLFDFNAALNASQLNFRAYSGGIQVNNMGAGTGTYNMSLEGFGQLIICAACSATSNIAVRGHFVITDNAGGAVTISAEAMFDHNSIIDTIATDTGTTIPANIATAQADLDILTGADGATLATAQGNYAPAKVSDLGIVQTGDHTASIAAIKVITDALTFAAATKLAISAGTMLVGTVSYDNTAATNTIFYCDDITEATENHFNGRIVIFTSGAVQYQATDILAYELVSGEGKFTVTGMTEAPADNVTFIIV
jgi:hypothetical protein